MAVALTLQPAVAHAQQTVTAPLNVTMNVVTRCVVTGSTVDLGRYPAGTPRWVLSQSLGFVDIDQTTTGTVLRPSGRPLDALATVQCPVGVEWSLTVAGDTSTEISLVSSRAEPGDVPLRVVPYASRVDGVPIQGGERLLMGVSNFDRVTGTGNNQIQVIQGGYLLSNQDALRAGGGGRGDEVLDRGLYSSSGATVVLDFVPAL